MDPVRSHGGMSRPDSFMRMGYIGPKKKPTKETATASPTSEGVSQTTSSSLRRFIEHYTREVEYEESRI